MSDIVIPKGSKENEVEQLCGEILNKTFSVPELRELSASCLTMITEKRDYRADKSARIESWNNDFQEGILVPKGSKKKEVEQLCGEVLKKAFILPSLRELNVLCIIMCAEKKDVRVDESGCIISDMGSWMDMAVDQTNMEDSDNVALLEVD